MSTKEEEEEEEGEEEEEDKKKGGESNQLKYDGIYICKDGEEVITKKKYDQLFRGWEFSFL